MAGLKRSHSFADGETAITSKKQKVRRKLRHVQIRPPNIEIAPQEPIFAQGQLLKSIGAACVLAGFDSVQASALEMFRSHVEEYMLHLLSDAKQSMQQSRRTTPTALDFAQAFSLQPNTHTASLLLPQLDLSLPTLLATPTIQPPAPLPPSPPDLSNLLTTLAADRPAFIPSHLPPLPPRHAWKSSPVFAHREKDARRMRERATEEGMMAEQALRKLAAAEKAGRMKREVREEERLEKEGKGRVKRREREDTLGELLADLGEG